MVYIKIFAVQENKIEPMQLYLTVNKSKCLNKNFNILEMLTHYILTVNKSKYSN